MYNQTVLDLCFHMNVSLATLMDVMVSVLILVKFQ